MEGRTHPENRDVEAPQPQEERDDDRHEVDTHPWTDAVRWRPDSPTDELARERLDELFTEIPDEEVGSVRDIGWFGLLKHAGRPGGVVLSQNGYGFRDLWEIDSDQELTARWEELQREYDAFTEATRAHNREAEEARDSGDGHHPEIWVGSLSDYNNGRLHGVWLDATLDPDELHDAIQFMLRNSYERDAEEWAIMDYGDFGGLNLGEYASVEVVSAVAKGIAEHGPAFAAWVEYVGTANPDELERGFENAYLGAYESMEAYVKNQLEEGDAYRFMEYVPEWLQPYVEVDTDMLAQDMGFDLHVVEQSNGEVWVFDPRV